MFQALLDQQIGQHLPAELLEREEVQSFLRTVEKSYGAYERDREQLDHACRATQAEFDEVNRELRSLTEQKSRSLRELNRAAADLTQRKSEAADGGDLVSLSESIRGQVHLSAIVTQELSQSIDLFKAMFNNLKSATLIENQHNEILFANDLFCDYFAKALKPDEVVGLEATAARTAAKALFKNEEDFLAGIDRSITQRVPVYNERLEMKDGRVLERDYVPIFVDGDYKGHLWKFDDVTDKARYEDQLRQSEERNRLIMDSSLDAIVVLDMQGIIHGWNPQAEAMFGWTAEEACGQSGAKLILPTRHIEGLTAEMQGHMADHLVNLRNRVLELKAVNRNGVEFPIELAVATYNQDGQTFFAGFFKNISARKEWENRLRAEEAKFRNMISDINLGLLNITLDHEIVYVNQGFCRMTGYTEEELLGKHTDIFKFDDTAKQIAREKMDLSRQGVSGTMEIAARNKDGEKRWWFVSGAPSYNDRGIQTGAVVIYLDITEQKRLERELEVAKNSAEQASVAKEAFLANMSHEIRTPLNAIIGMIRELSREKLSPKQQNYLSHTDSAARHLLSIVNSILDISKIEAGELELEHHDFSLEALVANIQSILHIKAAQKGLSLDCRLSPRIWSAHQGDSARIRQILINLLGNSIKFTMQGSISLRAEVVKEDRLAQTIRIEVADTGIGMDETFLKDIFSKFSQAERSTSRRFGGTGLGMSITKEIVRLMDGTIEVSSEKGVGTKFTIHLKLVRGDVDKLTKQDDQSEHLLEGTRILLVEDNIMNRFIAGKSLNHFGCTVEEAENGRIALEMLRHKEYDLILMDIQMPELDGVATTKIIRQELKLDTPIIAVTANAFKKDIDLYLSIGMNDYVTKPFEERALFQTLLMQIRSHKRAVSAPPVAIDANYDLTKLRKLSRGDETFVRQMIEIFVTQTPVAMEEIRRAMEENDPLTVSKVAHRIKPSITSMGIGQLDGVARDIELYAKSEYLDAEVLANKVSYFQGTLGTVLAKIRKDCLLPH